MALGLKVLAVLFTALFVVIAVVVLPSHPLVERAYRCFVNMGECLTNVPTESMTSKMIPTMSYYGT